MSCMPRNTFSCRGKITEQPLWRCCKPGASWKQDGRGEPGHRRQAERDLSKALPHVEAHLARDRGQVDVKRSAAPQQLRKQRLPDALLPAQQ